VSAMLAPSLYAGMRTVTGATLPSAGRWTRCRRAGTLLCGRTALSPNALCQLDTEDLPFEGVSLMHLHFWAEASGSYRSCERCQRRRYSIAGRPSTAQETRDRDHKRVEPRAERAVPH